MSELIPVLFTSSSDRRGDRDFGDDNPTFSARGVVACSLVDLAAKLGVPEEMLDVPRPSPEAIAASLSRDRTRQR